MLFLRTGMMCEPTYLASDPKTVNKRRGEAPLGTPLAWIRDCLGEPTGELVDADGRRCGRVQ